jgi:hypothetical protein
MELLRFCCLTQHGTGVDNSFLLQGRMGRPIFVSESKPESMMLNNGYRID